MIAGLPWWVFMMILFIFLSGYMAFRAMRAERKLEEQFIEEQGNVYMERMEAERKQRQNQQQNNRQVSH
ncbi:sporulation YhaL family protein [Oceanobacillus halotolerans]|uniref:sporulation YhaL family protein n=1 Tax=Oceanobacillus halotolerans TaxID=2663380 RepID=UPI0013DCF221|nr:sporulation YhaL family protein [Oceanobacillus halotolerans]